MLWKLFCVLVSLGGLAVRGLTAGYVPRGTSGRNTQSQVAETLNTTGMYSIVRNPLYLGNFIINLGVAMSIQAWWLVAVLCLGFWLYYERIIFAEEEFLRNKFGQSFLRWAEVTPAFFPDFKLWQKPALPLSFKTFLRREFTTFFGIICALLFLSLAQEFLSGGKVQFKLSWLVVFAGNLFIYLSMLTLKKKTRILEVQGR